MSYETRVDAMDFAMSLAEMAGTTFGIMHAAETIHTFLMTDEPEEPPCDCECEFVECDYIAPESAYTVTVNLQVAGDFYA